MRKPIPVVLAAGLLAAVTTAQAHAPHDDARGALSIAVYGAVRRHAGVHPDDQR